MLYNKWVALGGVMKKILFLLFAAAIAAAGCAPKGQIKEEIMETRHYIQPLNPDVQREHVSFKNRYGITLAGDLYTAKNMDKNAKYPAIIVGAPYGGVKEQGPCVYAGELARRGFVVLTFDQPFMGESGGEPRHVSSADMFAESFSAGVDYLGLLQFVDRNKIGVIGICGSGGFALSAAQVDVRIKAVATASMYDMTSFHKRMSKEELQKAKEKLAAQRWIDAENGYPQYIPSFPEKPLTKEESDKVQQELPEPDAEWFRFYAVPRGHHPHARGGFTTTSDASMLNFKALDYIDEISPRPILFIIGDRAHSKFFSEEAYAAAKEPKEIYVVKDAEHIDLYDRTDRIPFDKLEEFFKTNLK